jgi:hypothetical protein
MGCSVRTAKGQTQRFLIWEMDMEIAIAMTVISGVVLNLEPNAPHEPAREKGLHT